MNKIQHTKIEHTSDIDRVNLLLQSNWILISVSTNRTTAADGSFTEILTYSIGKKTDEEDMFR